MKIIFVLLLFSSIQITVSSSIIYNKASKKGMTWKVKVWPTPANNFAGKLSCSNCNAKEGDTLCTKKIFFAEHKPKQFQDLDLIMNLKSSKIIKDNTLYNRWSGGRYSATPIIKGLYSPKGQWLIISARSVSALLPESRNIMMDGI